MLRVIAIVLLPLLLNASWLSGGVDWKRDYKTAFKEAGQTGKPILFYLSGESCKYCADMDEQVFKDESIAEKINTYFVAVKVMPASGEHLPNRLFRSGTPTVWLLDSGSIPMFKPLVGLQDKTMFSKALDVALKRVGYRPTHEAGLR